MSYVLVHGGGFAGSCWDRLVPHLDGPVFAVDLPGRGACPADLSAVTIADFVAAVVDELVANDLDDVVLVGHSLAGISLPGVAALQPDRLRRLVFVSCAVPPHGASVAQILASFGPATADVADNLGEVVSTKVDRLHPEVAAVMFCNDMDDDQTRFTLEHLVPESGGVLLEPVDLSGLASGVPRTYVRLLRDASLIVPAQDRMIANLGGTDVVEVVDLDAGHMAMISQPARLAATLNAM